MGSRYEVDVTIVSARELKNVNWRVGELVPYAVVWVEDGPKCSVRADVDNGVNPVWDEKLSVPLPPNVRLQDAVLRVDVVHADPAEGTKPLVGSARLPLRDVLDDVGIGSKAPRTLPLKRPSGRPQGWIELKVAVREAAPPRPRYYDPYPAPPYAQSREASYGQPPYGSSYPQPYGSSYAQPYAPPPAGYPYASPPPPPPPAAAYGADPYGAAPYGAAPYGAGGYVAEEKKKSKFGMGTGVAVGAAAGLLGGLALAEGADYVEDKIADDAADKVEDDLAYDDGGDYGGDDF